MLAPGLEVRQGAALREAEGTGWLRFAWKGHDVVIRPRQPKSRGSSTSLAVEAADAAFIDFVERTIDREAYVAAYADVAAAGLDPMRHWLEHGMREGRLLAPGVRVRHGRHASVPAGKGWCCFTWRGVPVAVLPGAEATADSVLAQIVAQARHEPAILAPGLAAVPNLRRFLAVDLAGREGLDVGGLLDAIGQRTDVVFLLPWLTLGGADKFAADMADALMAQDYGPVLVLVTDQHPEAATGWERLGILTPYHRARVVFWRSHCTAPRVDPMLIARLLNGLRPRALIVLNSAAGLEAVAKYGRGLGQATRIVCTYFSMGLEGVGNVSGRYMPRRTLPHAVALTDNSPMRDSLEQMFGGIPGPGIALLPPRILPASEDLFATRLALRGARAAAPPARWAWVSRIEPSKGTAVLAALARRRPADAFELFGPLEHPLGQLGLDRSNIRHQGTLPDVAAADFSDHDGFLFTSLFEGMPNVVLEMSQHAIPLVLADVGGLRDTLDRTAAIFVEHGTSAEETAAAFDVALERLRAMPPGQVTAMLRAARVQVLSRHSPDDFARGVAALFGTS
jgi:glycosyltransferase involved in cell wall biosynthesis